jgi:hypothetical protein
MWPPMLLLCINTCIHAYTRHAHKHPPLPPRPHAQMSSDKLEAQMSKLGAGMGLGIGYVKDGGRGFHTVIFCVSVRFGVGVSVCARVCFCVCTHIERGGFGAERVGGGGGGLIMGCVCVCVCVSDMHVFIFSVNCLIAFD